MLKGVLRMLVLFLVILLSLNAPPQSLAQNIESPKATLIIPKNNLVLAISRADFDSRTTKVGQLVSATTAEDLQVGAITIIPNGSLISGIVTKVEQPRRFPVGNGSITISFKEIKTPDGQTIYLRDKDITAKILPPFSDTVKGEAAKGASVRAASYGTTIPLNKATDLNGAAVYSIGVGASAAAGGVLGFIIPEDGSTRLNSAANGFINATPIGLLRWMGADGKDAYLRRGEGIILNVDKQTVIRIQDQRVALRGQ